MMENACVPVCSKLLCDTDTYNYCTDFIGDSCFEK